MSDAKVTRPLSELRQSVSEDPPPPGWTGDPSLYLIDRATLLALIDLATEEGVRAGHNNPRCKCVNCQFRKALEAAGWRIE